MSFFERGSTPVIVDDINVGILLFTLGFRQTRKATYVIKNNGKKEYHFHFKSTSECGEYDRNDVLKKWSDEEFLNDPENADNEIVICKFIVESRTALLDEIKGAEDVQHCFRSNEKVFIDEINEGDKALTEVKFGNSYGYIDANSDTSKKFYK